MGICCSCCGSGSGDDGAKEMELQAQKSRKALDISTKMSAPTITRASSNTNGVITGTGLALAGVPIEQDAAYWEWHIQIDGKEKHIGTIMFGVSSKKDSKFYKDLKDKVLPEDGTPSQVNGTQWMRRIDIENGDVIGVAVQQSDLPMVQFSLNGEPLHISAINRFKGTVYPSIFLPELGDEDGGGGEAAKSDTTITASLVVDEHEFKHKSPGQRFLPLIVARSIV